MSTNRNSSTGERRSVVSDVSERFRTASKMTLVGLTAAALAACGVGNDKEQPHPTVTVTADQSPNPSTTQDVTVAPSSTIEIPSTSEAPTSSSESETPSEQKLYVENPDGTVSFPVETYKENREQLVKDFVEVGLTNWINAGATKETADAAYKPSEGTPGVEKYLSEVASKNEKLYADNLFDQWESGDKPTERAIVGDFADYNKSVLLANFYSYGAIEYWNGPADQAGDPYKAQLKVGEITDYKEGPESNPYVSARVPITFTSNRDKSSLKDSSSVDSIQLLDGKTITPVFQITQVGEKYEITYYVDYMRTPDNN